MSMPTKWMYRGLTCWILEIISWWGNALNDFSIYLVQSEVAIYGSCKSVHTGELHDMTSSLQDHTQDLFNLFSDHGPGNDNVHGQMSILRVASNDVLSHASSIGPFSRIASHIPRPGRHNFSPRYEVWRVCSSYLTLRKIENNVDRQTVEIEYVYLSETG
jgi:hypothetical protein